MAKVKVWTILTFDLVIGLIKGIGSRSVIMDESSNRLARVSIEGVQVVEYVEKFARKICFLLL